MKRNNRLVVDMRHQDVRVLFVKGDRFELIVIGQRCECLCSLSSCVIKFLYYLYVLIFFHACECSECLVKARHLLLLLYFAITLTAYLKGLFVHFKLTAEH